MDCDARRQNCTDETETGARLLRVLTLCYSVLLPLHMFLDRRKVLADYVTSQTAVHLIPAGM